MCANVKEEISIRIKEEISTQVQEEMSTQVHEEMSTQVHEEISNLDEMSTKDKCEISSRGNEKTSAEGKVSKHKGKGKVIHTKERGIIRNVLRFCDREANMNALLYPLKKAQQRAAAATGVSYRTVIRIRKQALANPPESKLRTPGKHRRKRKGTQEDEDNPDSSPSKKPKLESRNSSDTSSDDEDKSETTDSCDPESEDEAPSVDPKTGEYVFEEGRMVDINFFVKCLRRANRHHDTLPCNLNDLFMYEEAYKNGILGIVFRCRVCLMVVIVWTQNPYDKVSSDQSHEHTIDISHRNRRGSSSPFPMDLISKKMRNLPKFRDVNQSAQSDPPLIGWPQVAKDSALPVSRSNPPLEPASKKSTVAELTFCVDQAENSPEPERVSVHSTDHSVSLPPKSTDTSSEISLKAKLYSARLKKQTTAKLLPKKSKTSDGAPQSPLMPKISPLGSATTLPPSIDQLSSLLAPPLQPRIGQLIGVRVPSLQPRINQSGALMVSTMQPRIIQASATIAPTLMASTTQPRLIPTSGKMTSSLQLRLNQSSAIMVSTMQPKLVQASATLTPTLMASAMPPRFAQASTTVTQTVMASTMQPRLIQASGKMAPPLQPKILQSSSVTNSPTGILSSPFLLIQRPLRPQSFQSSGPSATMVKPEQINQTAQTPLQPRFMQSIGPVTSSTGMVQNPSAQRPLPSRIVQIQPSGLRFPPTAMLKSERMLISQDVFVQRPPQPRIFGTTPDKIILFNDAFAHRPLVPGARLIKPEKITVTPDVFPHRISHTDSSVSSGSETPASPSLVAPETIISDISDQNNPGRQSGSTTDTLPVDLNLVKKEIDEFGPCDTS